GPRGPGTLLARGERLRHQRGAEAIAPANDGEGISLLHAIVRAAVDEDLVRLAVSGQVRVDGLDDLADHVGPIGARRDALLLCDPGADEVAALYLFEGPLDLDGGLRALQGEHPDHADGLRLARQRAVRDRVHDGPLGPEDEQFIAGAGGDLAPEARVRGVKGGEHLLLLERRLERTRTPHLLRSDETARAHAEDRRRREGELAADAYCAQGGAALPAVLADHLEVRRIGHGYGRFRRSPRQRLLLVGSIQRGRIDAGVHLRLDLRRCLRPALPGHDAQLVARIDPVRVLDRRVEAPDLRPIPGVAEELLREVPESVALLDGVFVRRAGYRLDGVVRRGASALLGDGRALAPRPGRILQRHLQKLRRRLTPRLLSLRLHGLRRNGRRRVLPRAQRRREKQGQSPAQCCPAPPRDHPRPHRSPPFTDPAGVAASAPTRAPAGAPRKAGSEPTWPRSCARGFADTAPAPAAPAARHRPPDTSPGLPRRAAARRRSRRVPRAPARRATRHCRQRCAAGRQRQTTADPSPPRRGGP